MEAGAPFDFHRPTVLAPHALLARAGREVPCPAAALEPQAGTLQRPRSAKSKRNQLPATSRVGQKEYTALLPVLTVVTGEGELRERTPCHVQRW